MVRRRIRESWVRSAAEPPAQRLRPGGAGRWRYGLRRSATLSWHRPNRLKRSGQRSGCIRIGVREIVGDGPCWSSEKSAVPATLDCWRQSLAEREVLDAARWMRAKIARLGPESGDVFLSGPTGLAAAGMPGGGLGSVDAGRNGTHGVTEPFPTWPRRRWRGQRDGCPGCLGRARSRCSVRRLVTWRTSEGWGMGQDLESPARSVWDPTTYHFRDEWGIGG